MEASPRVRKLMEDRDRIMRERDELYASLGEQADDNHGLREEVQRLRNTIRRLEA